MYGPLELAAESNDKRQSPYATDIVGAYHSHGGEGRVACNDRAGRGSIGEADRHTFPAQQRFLF